MRQVALAASGLVALLFYVDRLSTVPISFIWNLLFLLAMVGAFLLLLNRFWLSTALVTVGYIIAVGIDRTKFYYMDDHLRWSDITNVTRHFDTYVGFIQFVELLSPYIIGIFNWTALSAASAFVFAIFAFYKLETPYFNVSAQSPRVSHRLTAGGLTLIITLVGASITAHPTFQVMHAVRLSASNYQLAGMPMFLFATMGAPSSAQNWSAEDAIIASQISAKAGSVVRDQYGACTLPDIVVWFNESTFDPQDLALSGLQRGVFDSAALPILPMFRDGHNTVQYGALNVGIFGGKSWNTVFAFQSGAHLSWFSDDTYAASSLSGVLKDTFFKRLKRAGYSVASLYAQDGYLFDARRSELEYGADAFYGTEFITPSNQVISGASDADVADALRRLVSRPASSPRAFFVFTSANHGPYPSSTFKRDRALVAKWGDLPDGALDYIGRVTITDRVLSTLTGELLSRSRPTIVLHLGDHRPQIPGVAFPDDIKYNTYYHLLTNCSPSPSNKPLRQDSDIIYMASEILSIAGLGAGPIYAANRLLVTECQVPDLVCSQSGRRILRGYKLLTYNNLVKN